MKRKIYYVPGMISLVMLPILIHYWQREHQVNQLYALEINTFKKGYRIMDIEVKPPDRKYVTIELDENHQDNLIKLAYGEVLIKEMKSRNDTVSGVHFRLTEKCQYNDFVQAINLKEKYNVRMCLFQTPDIWFAEQSRRIAKLCASLSNCIVNPPVVRKRQNTPDAEAKKIVVIGMCFLSLSILSFFRFWKLTRFQRIPIRSEL